MIKKKKISVKIEKERGGGRILDFVTKFQMHQLNVQWLYDSSNL